MIRERIKQLLWPFEPREVAIYWAIMLPLCLAFAACIGVLTYLLASAAESR